MRKYFTISSILIALLFLFLFSLRFVYLDRIPSGLAHDEIIYTLNRITVLYNGTDSGGIGLPLAFFMTKTEGNISILPVLLNMPLHLFLPSDQITARLPYAIINIATAVTLFFLTYYLLKNKTIGILAALLFLINPWSFFLSRFATESPYALLFLLLGITLSLKLRGWYLLLPFFCFLLAFFSYHGAKIIILPVVIVLFIFLSKTSLFKKLTRKEMLSFLAGIAAIYVLFFIVNLSMSDSIIAERQDELFFLDNKKISESVNKERSLSIESPSSPLFQNKYTSIGQIFLKQYITAFSTQVLFISGDTRLIYSYIQHGFFYYFDAFLILTGLFFLWMKQRRLAVFITVLILIAPIPSAISSIAMSYAHRSFLLLPLFIMLSAVGLYVIYKYLSKKIHHFIALGLLALVILIPVIYFFHFYFYRYPVISGEYYSLDERVLAKFIKESQTFNKPIISVVDDAGDVYFNTAYYSNDRKITSELINNIEKFHENDYSYQNITFRGDCPQYTKDEIIIVQWTKPCVYEEQPRYLILNPKDAGLFYKIYNSDLCRDLALSKYRSNNVIEDYAIERMDRKMFCERWLSIK